jgi:hypothetical protein
MARAPAIEEESGTCSGFLHPHNGYAGDFTQALVAQVPTPGWGLPAPQTGARSR